MVSKIRKRDYLQGNMPIWHQIHDFNKLARRQLGCTACTYVSYRSHAALVFENNVFSSIFPVNKTWNDPLGCVIFGSTHFVKYYYM